MSVSERPFRGSLIDKELERARNRFYPGWWIYSQKETRPSLQPFYRVECGTQRELDLARLSKLPFVRAEIVHKTTSMVQGNSADVDQLMSKLRDAGLDVPGSPYAEEGLLQMHDALGRLSQILKLP